jgi:hypothetical protein
MREGGVRVSEMRGSEMRGSEMRDSRVRDSKMTGCGVRYRSESQCDRRRIDSGMGDNERQ